MLESLKTWLVQRTKKMTSTARALMNEQIDYTISIIPETSSMFRNWIIT